MLARIRSSSVPRTSVAPRAPRAPRVLPLARLLGLPGAVLLALSACAGARRPVMCTRTCDEGYECVAGECLRLGNHPDVEALDKFGLYKSRRLVLPAVDVLRLAPGDAEGEVPRVATLGRARDGASLLLLRFALDLPPDATVIEAHVILDRAPASLSDPAPIALHAARIVEPWDARSVAWGRAPRLDESGAPLSIVDPARPSVRIDVRMIVSRWRRHAPEDQGIAIVADRMSATGLTFALADGAGGTEETPPIFPGRTLKDTPPTFHAPANALDVAGEAVVPRGPRLEVYVRP
jgi:hypothetical protein